MIGPAPRLSRPAILAVGSIAVLSGALQSTTATGETDLDDPRDPAADWIEHSVSCLAKTRTLEADFTQEVIHRLDGRAEVARGKLQLRRGRRLRMEYLEPHASLLVSDGNIIRAWNAETRTLYESPARGTVVARALSYVLDKSANDDFQTRWLGGDEQPAPGKRGVIELRPKLESELATRIVITLTGDCPPLLRFTIIDRAGTATRLTLANQRLGGIIPAGRFEFDPPPGAKIVKP